MFMHNFKIKQEAHIDYDITQNSFFPKCYFQMAYTAFLKPKYIFMTQVCTYALFEQNKNVFTNL